MNKTLTTAALALALVWTSTASATQSRIRSMGGGIKQLTVPDDTNIFFLPAELVKYGTWAAIEIGAADVTGGRAAPGTSFQIHYNFNPTAVLAVYGSNQSPSAMRLGAPGAGNRFSDLSGSATFVGCGGGRIDCNTGDVGSTAKGTVLFAIDLGASRLGFMLGVWGDMAKSFDANGNATDNAGPLFLDFGIGAGFAVGSGDVDLGLKVTYATPTDEDINGTRTESSEIDIGVVFRGTFPFSGPHEIVPYAMIDLGFGSSLQTGSTSENTGFLFNFDAGIDVRLNLGDGIIVQPGIGLAGGTYNMQNTNNGVISNRNQSSFTFPYYNLAVDVKITEWFDIRFGGAQRVYWTWNGGDDDGIDIAGTQSQANVEHKLSTGVGFTCPRASPSTSRWTPAGGSVVPSS